jgi:hypothetical protein
MSEMSKMLVKEKLCLVQFYTLKDRATAFYNDKKSKDTYRNFSTKKLQSQEKVRHIQGNKGNCKMSSKSELLSHKARGRPFELFDT